MSYKGFRIPKTKRIDYKFSAKQFSKNTPKSQNTKHLLKPILTWSHYQIPPHCAYIPCRDQIWQISSKHQINNPCTSQKRTFIQFCYQSKREVLGQLGTEIKYQELYLFELRSHHVQPPANYELAAGDPSSILCRSSGTQVKVLWNLHATRAQLLVITVSKEISTEKNELCL